METFCSYFLDFQFRQFGFSLPTFSLVLGLALSERVAPSFALNLLQIKRWSLLTGISFHGSWKNRLRRRIDFPPVFCLTLSLCTSIGLKSTFLLDSKKVEVKVGRNLSPLFVEANDKGSGEPTRDETNLDVCPWPRCVYPSALLRAVPGQMGGFCGIFVAASRE